MSLVTSQRETLLRLTATLRPHFRTDRTLPSRIRALLSGDRRFGSRDRRLYRELLFTTVRFLPWLEGLLDTDPARAAATVAWLSAETPATRAFRAELTIGFPPKAEDLFERAAALGREVSSLVPAWLAAECPAALAPEEMNALHRRAPLWLRLQAGDATALAREIGDAGVRLSSCAVLPEAVRATTPDDASEADLTRTASYLHGDFEVQDLGSQMVLASQEILPGERWLDACAGAGGKTLQLACMLGKEGRVDAYDVRSSALDELGERVARAGLENVRTLRELPGGPAGAAGSEGYDGILVDAPCSGSGTWRRAPHLKWLTTPDDLIRHAERQRHLLAAFAPMVRAGGNLLYSTCSLARTENEEVAKSFLETHSDFEPLPPARDFGYDSGAPGLAILPALHDTDGFYVVALHRAR
ncbi:MAG: RsmB/NOP family class I SAM-dependent RNA methyltransferase [Gemmatimonadota bacterium]